MDQAAIERLRERIEELKKVMRLAHDPRMISLLKEVIDSGEADLRRLEDIAKEDSGHSGRQ